MDLQIFERENHERIKAVEKSFGRAGGVLSKPGRILMGHGRLMKQSRKKREPKMFFLFNDILVYGSILMNGRWFKNQKIIPLEDIMQEDMEDGEAKHQWLMRTPSKSFFVSAPSEEEKQDWIKHVNECRSDLLQASNRQPGKKFAVSWIPDPAAYKCMRCLTTKFGGANRRHHCRECGFLVCNGCSKQRAVISNIHPTKPQRICTFCHRKLGKEEEVSRHRGDSAGKSSSEEEEAAASSDECCIKKEEEEELYDPSSWLDIKKRTWGRLSTYDYPRPVN